VNLVVQYKKNLSLGFGVLVDDIMFGVSFAFLFLFTIQ